jgi:DNA-binding transcriptional MerR regulator
MASGHADDGVSEGQTTLGEFEATKLYYRIGEVAELTGVKPYVLRYWETEFKWMAPQKSRSKQRLYRPKDIEMVFLIKKLLYEERFTIAGARKRLKGLGVDRAKAEAEPPPGPAPATIRKELLRMREELVAIRDLM